MKIRKLLQPQLIAIWTKSFLTAHNHMSLVLFFATRYYDREQNQWVGTKLRLGTVACFSPIGEKWWNLIVNAVKILWNIECLFVGESGSWIESSKSILSTNFAKKNQTKIALRFH